MADTELNGISYFIGNYVITVTSLNFVGIVGNFTGNYSRDFVGEYTRTSTRTSNRDFIGDMHVNLWNYRNLLKIPRTRESTYNRTVSNYTRLITKEEK